MASDETADGPVVRVFVSYSHRDASYLETDSLLGFLRGMERSGVRFWTDREIATGDRWEDVIQTELARTDIALALVSQAFLDSPYCQDVEIRELLSRRITVLPLILSPCDWLDHPWLAETQALPLEGRTVEEHFVDDGARKRLFHDYRQALQAHADRIRGDARRPTGTSAATSPRLPALPELFVGRDATVQQVVELTGQRRLVALLGQPGSGKTALAMHVAHARREDFRDGVWWCELDAIEEEELVPLTLARTLGIREQAHRPPTEILADHLADAEALLVLDNCEHLIDACRALIRELLDDCPGVRVLVTSIVGLQLVDQQSFPVRPLDVPDETVAMSPEALLDIAGVELFVETYRLADPQFELDRSNAEAITKIVARLDGIPLAIRLAAAGCAQSMTLTISTLADQLSDVLPLLEQPDVADPDALDRPHHLTMEATLDWSFGLLDAPSRRLARRLAVFVGGFTWDDVASVCYEAVDDADENVLAKLARHSLIVPASNAGQGPKRFRLLEFVRQYGRRQLEAAGERDRWVARHGAHFVALAEAAAERFLGDGQAEWVERVEVDLPNLRAALVRATERGDRDTALRLSASIWRFWELRGYLSEGRERIETVLEAFPGDSRLHLTLYEGGSLLAYRQGDLVTAETLIRRALDLARAFDDPARISNALNDLGNIAMQRGDMEGRLVVAEERYSLEASFDPRDDRELAVSLNNLGGTLLHLGDFERARRCLTEAVELFEGSANPWESGFPLAGLGTLALFEEHFDEAERFYRLSYEARLPTDEKRGMGEAMNGLARVAVRRGDWPAARERLQDALALRREAGDLRGMAETLECLVFFLRAHGRFLDGVRILAGATELRRPGGSVPKPLFQPYLDGFRKAALAHLGAAAYNAADIEGQQLGRRAILALAGDLLAKDSRGER